MRTVKIGSRESRLAVLQSELLQHYLEARGIPAELVTMKTTGDIILDRSLEQVGGKGLFVKELDRALLDRRSDVSVHSCKDLPMEVPETLPILGFSRREDPRDVLVLPEGCDAWDRTRPVGCSSRRRMLQLKALYPDVTFQGIRGNVLTRLSKLDGGQYGALVLAAAGLKRLGLECRISRYFTPEEMIPAAGQGILCVQGRVGEDYSYLNGFFDQMATNQAAAERAFVAALNGGCSSPIAAFADEDGAMLHLQGLYYSEASGQYLTGELTGASTEAVQLGVRLAMELKAKLDGGNAL